MANIPIPPFRGPRLSDPVKTKAGEQAIDVAEQELLSRNRQINLYGQISHDSVALVAARLLLLQSRSHEPIHLIIDSSGGNVDDSLALVDLMELISAPVHTHCAGGASGMAAMVLAAGTRGGRTAFPHSRIQFAAVVGRDEELTEKQLALARTVVPKKLSKYMRRSVAEVIHLLQTEAMFTPETAVTSGLIDGIVGA